MEPDAEPGALETGMTSHQNPTSFESPIKYIHITHYQYAFGIWRSHFFQGALPV
jgi:hypothetical protein